MLRGTLVKVNNKCNLEHLIGLTGFAFFEPDIPNLAKKGYNSVPGPKRNGSAKGVPPKSTIAPAIFLWKALARARKIYEDAT